MTPFRIAIFYFYRCKSMSISLENIYEIYEKGCKHNDHGNLKMASVFIKEAIKACESLIDNSKTSKDRSNAIQVTINLLKYLMSD